jgi:hypothetical protein
MLAQRAPRVHHLFYRCMINTDQILDQIVRDQRPKYDFECGLFDPDALRTLGIAQEDALVDSYRDARELMLDVVARNGYVIPVIDVFYLPHCPEYRSGHVVHTVTLTGYDAAAGQWSILDDNPASVLCAYSSPSR